MEHMTIGPITTRRMGKAGHPDVSDYTNIYTPTVTDEDRRLAARAVRRFAATPAIAHDVLDALGLLDLAADLAQ